MPAIEISDLCKDFPLPERGKFVRAVDQLSLTIEENCIFGLLGPNGSGKSTTVKILLGLSRPSRGSCKVLGQSPDAPSARARIGYLPDAPYYYRFLSGRELVLYYGRLLGIEAKLAKRRAGELLERFGLADAADRKLGSYSKGMLQRLGFAQALIGDPEVLILDEPTAGVDPVGAAEVGEFILDLKTQGKTVLLCSHLLSQVESICDQVGILNKGRLLAEGSVADLLSQGEADRLSIRGVSPTARSRIERIAAEAGGSVEAGGRTLDEVFLDLVASDDRFDG